MASELRSDAEPHQAFVQILVPLMGVGLLEGNPDGPVTTLLLDPVPATVVGHRDDVAEGQAVREERDDYRRRSIQFVEARNARIDTLAVDVPEKP